MHGVETVMDPVTDPEDLELSIETMLDDAEAETRTARKTQKPTQAETVEEITVIAEPGEVPGDEVQATTGPIGGFEVIEQPTEEGAVNVSDVETTQVTEQAADAGQPETADDFLIAEIRRMQDQNAQPEVDQTRMLGLPVAEQDPALSEDLSQPTPSNYDGQVTEINLEDLPEYDAR